MNSDRARQQAEKAFKQDERAGGGHKTMTDYEARSRDIREKIERLRAIQFARQAQEQTEPQEPANTKRQTRREK